MTTDITYCANNFGCSAKTVCRRSLSIEAGIKISKETGKSVLFDQFEPEKGRACKGHLAILSLTPLENEK